MKTRIRIPKAEMSLSRARKEAIQKYGQVRDEKHRNGYWHFVVTK